MDTVPYFKNPAIKYKYIKSEYLDKFKYYGRVHYSSRIQEIIKNRKKQYKYK